MTFNDLLTKLNDFMYTYVLIIMLAGVGIYFTVRTRGVQFRLMKDGIKSMMEKAKTDDNGEKEVSSFQALMISTASRVGTGNIAGIATAIATGGPGAVFWMWVMALIGGASAFVESTLAQIYKVRQNGQYRGGPSYYMERALGKRWMGILFSILLILCFAYGFNGLQAYNMSSALEYYIPNYSDSRPYYCGSYCAGNLWRYTENRIFQFRYRSDYGRLIHFTWTCNNDYEHYRASCSICPYF